MHQTIRLAGRPQSQLWLWMFSMDIRKTNGCPPSFFFFFFFVSDLQMTVKNGYTWIIDTSSPDGLDAASLTGTADNQGVFILSLREGQGAEYESFLSMWRRADVRNKYPYISVFDTPPKGFM
jgi:hypothetical protein